MPPVAFWFPKLVVFFSLWEFFGFYWVSLLPMFTDTFSFFFLSVSSLIISFFFFFCEIFRSFISDINQVSSKAKTKSTCSPLSILLLFFEFLFFLFFLAVLEVPVLCLYNHSLTDVMRTAPIFLKIYKRMWWARQLNHTSRKHWCSTFVHFYLSSSHIYF